MGLQSVCAALSNHIKVVPSAATIVGPFPETETAAQAESEGLGKNSRKAATQAAAPFWP